jgi:hypothetical protein
MKDQAQSSAVSDVLARPCQTDRAGLVCDCKIFAITNLKEAPKMNRLRQISALIVLSLILAISVTAGQVESPGAPAPPPTNNSATQPSSTTTLIVLAVLRLIYR